MPGAARPADRLHAEPGRHRRASSSRSASPRTRSSCTSNASRTRSARAGRLRSAVPRAWVRARRTILSADAVSFLAAAILYLLAIGDVKGFAFTLGMSTVLDLVVVFLFTHPLMAVLARFKSFGSSRFSGLGRVEHTRRASSGARPAAANSSAPVAARRHRTGAPHDPRRPPTRRRRCPGRHRRRRAAGRRRASLARRRRRRPTRRRSPTPGCRRRAGQMVVPGSDAQGLAGPPALQRRGRPRRRRQQQADLQGHRRRRAALPRCRWSSAASTSASTSPAATASSCPATTRAAGRGPRRPPRTPAPRWPAAQVVGGDTDPAAHRPSSTPTTERAVVDAVADAAGHRSRSEVSPEAVSAEWGNDITDQALIALVVFLVAVVLFLARPVPAEDGGRRDRGAAPRHHRDRGHLLAGRLRGHARRRSSAS